MMNRKTFKKPLSMLMAVMMMLYNLSGTGLVLAEETEMESSGIEMEVQEVKETESQAAFRIGLDNGQTVSCTFYHD